MTVSRGINRPHRRWKPAEDRLLRKIYPNTPSAECAQRIGCRLQQIYSRAQKLGLEKSDAFKASAASGRMLPGTTLGAATRFTKGCRWSTVHRIKRGQRIGRATEFKRGHMPQTWVPIGTEVTDRDGYRKVKVSDDRKLTSRFNWRFVHRLVWERHRGKIPSTHMVVFRDGDKSNCRLRNLKLISKADNARRNQMHARYPKHVTDLIHAKAALQRRINREERSREKLVRRPTKPPVRAARKAQGREGAQASRARARQGQGRVRRRRQDHRPGQGRGRRRARAR